MGKSTGGRHDRLAIDAERDFALDDEEGLGFARVNVRRRSAPRGNDRIDLRITAAGFFPGRQEPVHIADHAGDPATQAQRDEETGADELVILDVSATPEGRSTAAQTVAAVRAAPTMPPAGPDRIASLPWKCPASVKPPLDCMK